MIFHIENATNKITKLKQIFVHHQSHYCHQKRYCNRHTVVGIFRLIRIALLCSMHARHSHSFITLPILVISLKNPRKNHSQISPYKIQKKQRIYANEFHTAHFSLVFLDFTLQ